MDSAQGEVFGGAEFPAASWEKERFLGYAGLQNRNEFLGLEQEKLKFFGLGCLAKDRLGGLEPHWLECRERLSMLLKLHIIPALALAFSCSELLLFDFDGCHPLPEPSELPFEAPPLVFPFSAPAGSLILLSVQLIFGGLQNHIQRPYGYRQLLNGDCLSL